MTRTTTPAPRGLRWLLPAAGLIFGIAAVAQTPPAVPRAPPAVPMSQPGSPPGLPVAPMAQPPLPSALRPAAITQPPLLSGGGTIDLAVPLYSSRVDTELVPDTRV